MMATGGGPARPDDEPELFLETVTSKDPFEEAFSQLARAIRLGAVPVGERFPSERALSEKLGISRNTVREAIRGLERAGYISTRRGRYGGSFVVSEESLLSSKGKSKVNPAILETLDFRMAIEPGVVSLAAGRATDEQVEQMRALADVEPVDTPTVLRANCRLHILFAQAAHCSRLLRQVKSVEDETLELMQQIPDLNPSETRSRTQHVSIIEAIAAGDAAGARTTMEQHLAATDMLLRELLSAKTLSR